MKELIFVIFFITAQNASADQGSKTTLKPIGISLKNLSYQSDPDALIRQATDIHGFVIDQAAGDIILIASSGPKAVRRDINLELGDFIAAVQNAFSGSEPPYCSLDPDPEQPSGPQQVRLGGVSQNTHFAKVMLDADYQMKLLAAGKRSNDGLQSFWSLLVERYGRNCSAFNELGQQGLLNRFWFYPQQPEAGDILQSSGGMTIWVKARVRLLTEEMFQTEAGLVDAGSSNPLAVQFADDFTSQFPSLAASNSIFYKLQNLFQWVYLAKLLNS
ncbi:MAG: DUF1598 domain-containing protein, partial [Elusimicrobia bacterium]|nr:DUF1598 domain-containing protein [Elusimicrobiota bacterium]